MKPSIKMNLFNVIIEKHNKDLLLTNLAKTKSVHIKSKKIYQKKQSSEEELYESNIKNLRVNLNSLFNRLEISKSDLLELQMKQHEKMDFVEKDSHDLLKSLSNEVNFFNNRFNELDIYISKTEIELEKINTIKKSYQFIEKFNVSRENLLSLTQFNFKVYTTFSKNLSILKNIFDFSEFPNVIQMQPISNDRTAFFVICTKEKENDLKERIRIIHAEEVPLLKKYISIKGINFERINKELNLIENTLIKYKKEKKRIRDENLLKFAAINEVAYNLEEYNWAINQFEERSLNHLSFNFFVPKEKKEQIKKKLINSFQDKIIINIYIIDEKGNIKRVHETKTPIDEKLSKKESNLKNNYQNKDIGSNIRQDDIIGETPTIMKHNRVIRPFETLTKMYCVPSYSEIDPTPFLFITFPLLFGIMFGDIGHGLVLIISGIIGSIVFKKRGGDLYNFCWIIFWCGCWAILAGLLYGEFFGSENILGFPLHPIPIPIPFVGSITLFDPLKNVMTIFILTIFIGVIHINLGWFLQIVNFCKKSQKYKAFTESFMKILFLDFGILIISIWGINLNKWFASPFPPILLPLIPGLFLILFKPIGKIIGISYMKKKSYGELLGEGSMDTFETVLSVPSNVLSYIRILALALAHVSLMLAIKAMISIIPGEGIFVQIIIIICLIFGNIIVILLEGVLVFLNAIRLHFYEFFFKFYEGAGTEFIPFILQENFSTISFKIDTEKDDIAKEIDKEIETKEIKEKIDSAKNYIIDKFF